MRHGPWTVIAAGERKVTGRAEGCQIRAGNQPRYAAADTAPAVEDVCEEFAR